MATSGTFFVDSIPTIYITTRVLSILFAYVCVYSFILIHIRFPFFFTAATDAAASCAAAVVVYIKIHPN